MTFIRKRITFIIAKDKEFAMFTLIFDIGVVVVKSYE